MAEMSTPEVRVPEASVDAAAQALLEFYTGDPAVSSMSAAKVARYTLSAGAPEVAAAALRDAADDLMQGLRVLGPVAWLRQRANAICPPGRTRTD